MGNLPTATDVKLSEKSNTGLAAPKALLDAELRKTLNIIAMNRFRIAITLVQPIISGALACSTHL